MLALNMNIFWTFFNLIVLYLLMRRFLFGPVNKFMEKRSNEISDSLKQAAKTNEQAMELKNQYEAALANAESEAHAILKNAKQNAVREYDEVLHSAKLEAVQVLRDGEKALALETEKAIKDVQAEIVSIALMAAEKTAKQGFDKVASQKLVDEFILEAGVAK